MVVYHLRKQGVVRLEEGAGLLICPGLIEFGSDGIQSTVIPLDQLVCVCRGRGLLASDWLRRQGQIQEAAHVPAT